MRERIVNENIDRAGDDVVGGRAELAFLANDFAFAVMMKNGRALGPILELGARDLFERWKMFEELIDRQRFARRQFFNRVGHGLCEPMIRQRSTALEAISPAVEERCRSYAGAEGPLETLGL